MGARDYGDVGESVIEQLLEEGLDLYGRGKEDEAVRCWQQVLALAPTERRARDYLESAGHAAEAAPAPASSERRPSSPRTAPPVPEPPAVDRDVVRELVREERYEEALNLLYGARARRPDDASLSRTIGALKERLAPRYLRELGSLDQVPFMLAWRAQRITLEPEQREALRLVDGLATYSDVLAASQLGRFETLQLLALLVRRGALGVRSAAPAAEPSADEAPPTRRSQAPAASRVTPRPPPSHSGRRALSPLPAALPPEEYAATFERATEAYLAGDVPAALRLYEACVAARPGDAVAAHNVERLRRRLAGA